MSEEKATSSPQAAVRPSYVHLNAEYGAGLFPGAAENSCRRRHGDDACRRHHTC